ncbi:XRE family transcriptional regulator [Flavobacterium cheongpyeongense]|uniref:XRE family transcriptional regulator n=1 Tax=Flavobacterium cheongpyeongense TaxID=2212651 RepID=A0A2V4BPQ9_9FLAO|nr:helix-turn-helix transcriptional regulator [Flavobacterium cheongpyeongense]PXY40861.1 XRE family transcriptional regulator [Flavobacterium cheongpyeongense]
MSNEDNRTEFRILFGKQIEKLRTDQKLSLRQLAQRCDLDHSDIAKYEKGEVNIKLSTVYELIKGLQLSPQTVFDFEFYFKDSNIKLEE